MTKRQAEKLCQCPERGDLHFYYENRRDSYVSYKVCQCPERGDLHFYFQDNITRIEASLQVCQCPERGDLHFYEDHPID